MSRKDWEVSDKIRVVIQTENPDNALRACIFALLKTSGQLEDQDRISRAFPNQAAEYHLRVDAPGNYLTGDEVPQAEPNRNAVVRAIYDWWISKIGLLKLKALIDAAANPPT
jgi:hypothetical protein